MFGERGPRIPVDPFVAVGAVVLAGTAVAWALADNPLPARVVQASLPALVGLALLGHGLRRPASDAEADRRLTLVWAAVGTGAFVLIGVWFFVVGATFETSYWVAVVSSLAVGASLGLLIGGYAGRLRAANRQLRDRTERLEQFASIVSHDLRNPLAVASGRLDLARTELDGDADPAAVDDELATVADAHDRMERLTDRLLALAREGDAVEDPVPFDLATVAQESWDVVATDDARLDVDVTTTVRGDRDRVCQLFENLFRNSVEHSSTGSRRQSDSPSVTVTVGSLDDGFYVGDDGPGIPPDERERVLEYGQSGGEGTGLGLAIVSRVADAHGWSLTVTEGQAGGARFEFRGVDRATDG